MGVRGVLESIALVAQLTGLDAIMLITLAACFLRILRCKAECTKLEECLRELHAQLQRPAPTGLNVATLFRAMDAETLIRAVVLDMVTQLRVMAPETFVQAVGIDMATQLRAMAGETLVEADGLVVSYRQSSFWCLVQTGSSMEARLLSMQDRLNRLCAFVRRVHDNLCTGTVHPVSDTNNDIVISVQLHGAETSDSQTYNGTSQGGEDNESDNTEPGGSE